MSKPDAAVLWARRWMAGQADEADYESHVWASEIISGQHDDDTGVCALAEAFRAGQASHNKWRAAAFSRQADNMAFILNHFDVPAQWYDKFTQELADDRAAFIAAKGQQ